MMTYSGLNLEIKLKKINPKDHRYIEILYNWNSNENQFEYFTCRPIHEYLNFEEYITSITKHIRNGVQFYVLKSINDKNTNIYGEISMFDYNPRNHSAEFGYYLPKQNRGKGLGRVMINLFLDLIFKDKDLNLHKIYATTASCNTPSIRLLEQFDFCLDGKLRDHYWIGNNKQDQFHYSLLKEEWDEKTRRPNCI